MNKLLAVLITTAMLYLFSGPLLATPVFVSMHSEDVGGGPGVPIDLAEAEKKLRDIATLGAQGVRTDIGWNDLQPDGPSSFNQDVLDAFIRYFRLAQEQGLEPMVIVSRAPGWASDLLKFTVGEKKRELNEAAFWKSYEAYVEVVIEALFDAQQADCNPSASPCLLKPVRYIQMWNEANHIIDPVDKDEDYNYFEIAGNIIEGLLGSPSSGGPLKLVNVMADMPLWEKAVDKWIEGAGNMIDVIGVDHYPGTWALVPYADWRPLKTLVKRINDEEDSWYGKQGAVLETGFSTWNALIANQSMQKLFVERALPKIREIADDTNLGTSPHIGKGKAPDQYQVILFNWYALVDAKKHGLQEAHFGIYNYNGSQKRAYKKLKKQIAEMSSAAGYAVNLKFAIEAVNASYQEQVRANLDPLYLTKANVQALTFENDARITSLAGAGGGGLAELPNLLSLDLTGSPVGASLVGSSPPFASNTNLTTLNLNNTGLPATGINITPNTALENLYLADNNLTNMDVSALTALEILDVSGNSLGTGSDSPAFDLTQNTEIVHLNLSNGNTALETINLSGMASLVTLDASQDAQNQNGLTSIDISGNPALKEALLANNQITGVDLSNNCSLETLDLTNNGLTDPNIMDSYCTTALASGRTAEATDRSLTTLLLGGNHISGQLTISADQYPHLQLLVVDGNDITGLTLEGDFEDLEEIDANGLDNLATIEVNGSNTSLTTVNASGNQSMTSVSIAGADNIQTVVVEDNANLTNMAFSDSAAPSSIEVAGSDSMTPAGVSGLSDETRENVDDIVTASSYSDYYISAVGAPLVPVDGLIHLQNDAGKLPVTFGRNDIPVNKIGIANMFGAGTDEIGTIGITNVFNGNPKLANLSFALNITNASVQGDSEYAGNPFYMYLFLENSAGNKHMLIAYLGGSGANWSLSYDGGQMTGNVNALRISAVGQYGAQGADVCSGNDMDELVANCQGSVGDITQFTVYSQPITQGASMIQMKVLAGDTSLPMGAHIEGTLSADLGNNPAGTHSRFVNPLGFPLDAANPLVLAQGYSALPIPMGHSGSSAKLADLSFDIALSDVTNEATENPFFAKLYLVEPVAPGVSSPTHYMTDTYYTLSAYFELDGSTADLGYSGGYFTHMDSSSTVQVCESTLLGTTKAGGSGCCTVDTSKSLVGQSCNHECSGSGIKKTCTGVEDLGELRASPTRFTSGLPAVEMKVFAGDQDTDGLVKAKLNVGGHGPAPDPVNSPLTFVGPLGHDLDANDLRLDNVLNGVPIGVTETSTLGFVDAFDAGSTLANLSFDLELKNIENGAVNTNDPFFANLYLTDGTDYYFLTAIFDYDTSSATAELKYSGGEFTALGTPSSGSSLTLTKSGGVVQATWADTVATGNSMQDLVNSVPGLMGFKPSATPLTSGITAIQMKIYAGNADVGGTVKADFDHNASFTAPRTAVENYTRLLGPAGKQLYIENNGPVLDNRGSASGIGVAFQSSTVGIVDGVADGTALSAVEIDIELNNIVTEATGSDGTDKAFFTTIYLQGVDSDDPDCADTSGSSGKLGSPESFVLVAYMEYNGGDSSSVSRGGGDGATASLGFDGSTFTAKNPDVGLTLYHGLAGLKRGTAASGANISDFSNTSNCNILNYTIKGQRGAGGGKAPVQLKIYARSTAVNGSITADLSKTELTCGSTGDCSNGSGTLVGPVGNQYTYGFLYNPGPMFFAGTDKARNFVVSNPTISTIGVSNAWKPDTQVGQASFTVNLGSTSDSSKNTDLKDQTSPYMVGFFVKGNDNQTYLISFYMPKTSKSKTSVTMDAGGSPKKGSYGGSGSPSAINVTMVNAIGIQQPNVYNQTFSSMDDVYNNSPVDSTSLLQALPITQGLQPVQLKIYAGDSSYQSSQGSDATATLQGFESSPAPVAEVVR